ncbi:MAG: hypothetical protein HQL74_16045 [Magnetococcales bacterium]|nr:hypothetical protein [Magnetococcales bacterium]
MKSIIQALTAVIGLTSRLFSNFQAKGSAGCKADLGDNRVSRLSGESWGSGMEIPNSKLARLINEFTSSSRTKQELICDILARHGCLSEVAMGNVDLVQEEIRQNLEWFTKPNVVMPNDMCDEDIIVKSLYLAGILSDYGRLLYEESPQGGPNKNPFSGVGQSPREKLVVNCARDPGTGLVSRRFQNG